MLFRGGLLPARQSVHEKGGQFSSGGGFAAEQREHLSGYITRINFRSEVDISGCNFFRLRGTLHGRVRTELSYFLRRLVRRIQRRPNGTRANAVDADATLNQVLCQRLRKGMNGALR